MFFFFLFKNIYSLYGAGRKGLNSKNSAIKIYNFNSKKVLMLCKMHYESYKFTMKPKKREIFKQTKSSNLRKKNDLMALTKKQKQKKKS